VRHAQGTDPGLPGPDRATWLAQLPARGVKFSRGVAEDSVLGPRPGGVAPGDDADALALSHQATSLGLHGLGGGNPLERRRRDPARPASAPGAGPLTRGLNPNHNRVLKDVFKSAATGPLQDFYRRMVARGMREELARVTLTRKLAALTLRLWKKGERYDPAQLTQQAHEGGGRSRLVRARSLAGDSHFPGQRCGGQSHAGRRPGAQSCRGTRLTVGPSQDRGLCRCRGPGERCCAQPRPTLARLSLLTQASALGDKLSTPRPRARRRQE
jgi:hypothetical protein